MQNFLDLCEENQNGTTTEDSYYNPFLPLLGIRCSNNGTRHLTLTSYTLKDIVNSRALDNPLYNLSRNILTIIISSLRRYIKCTYPDSVVTAMFFNHVYANSDVVLKTILNPFSHVITSTTHISFADANRITAGTLNTSIAKIVALHLRALGVIGNQEYSKVWNQGGKINVERSSLIFFKSFKPNCRLPFMDSLSVHNQHNLFVAPTVNSPTYNDPYGLCCTEEDETSQPTTTNDIEEGNTPIIPDQGCCKIGLEIEFWSNNRLNEDFKQSNKIVDEYYAGQYELNHFLSEFKYKKDLKAFFRTVKKEVTELKTKAPFEFKTKAKAIDSKSLIFNGCHLHISLPTLKETISFFHYLKDYRIVERFKYENYPSARSIMSHHIWGSRRSSELRFKRKTKFSPVLFTRLDTIELRLWDNEDILTLSRADKIASFLLDTLKAFREDIIPSVWESTIDVIECTEDTTKMLEVIKEKLQENMNKHVITNNEITLPSKQRICFIPEEDNSRIELKGPKRCVE